ncbi:MAG: hypothetical protein NT078_01995 [Candidatus Azambacteria bacterium]|nr:hypothetical protein [Candidatus Azambacteria bacterium]
MDTFETIKKFLAEGGKCLLIENGKAIGIVLTVEEYELLQRGEKREVATHPIGEAIMREMDFPEASAEIADIEAVDDITLEDLGIDE